MKCPFLKETIKTYGFGFNGIRNKKIATEGFSECVYSECMAYKNGECLKVKSGSN